MAIIRSSNGFCLNKGSLMANGLYNISYGDELSDWFGEETYHELMEMTDDEFENECGILLKMK